MAQGTETPPEQLELNLPPDQHKHQGTQKMAKKKKKAKKTK
jgi:hypothetical protein